MWVLCVKTYSLDQCPHSLTLQIEHSVHTITHTHTHRVKAESVFCLSFIHPGEGCLHFLLLLFPPRAGTADFVFVFRSRCLFLFLVGVVVDDINRALFLLTSAILRTREESLEDTRITTETRAREFWFFFPLERIKTRNKQIPASGGVSTGKTPFKFWRILWHRC